MKNNEKAYQEACNNLRHYSNASFGVRALSTIQGLGLISFWANIFIKGNNLLLVSIPVAGLLFTYLLYRFHMGYFEAAKFFYETASKMETELFDQYFRPMQAYKMERDKKYASTLARFTVLHAAFSLVGVLFSLALILSFLYLKGWMPANWLNSVCIDQNSLHKY